jgi:predicted nuclease of restriction endonuclease-like (RecB) superfamily
LPAGYAALLAELKRRIRAAQLRAALSVNRDLVTLYWRIGRDILTRQTRESWGAKVIVRLSADLRRVSPEMTGFSPRNLKYMRAVAEAWDSEPFVRQAVARILLDHVRDFLLERGGEDFYLDLLFYHLRLRCFVVVDLPFYLSAVDDLMRRPDDHPSIGVILCMKKNRVVEYALRDTAKPIGVSAYRLAQHLPGKLKGRLPTVDELEAGLRVP